MYPSGNLLTTNPAVLSCCHQAWLESHIIDVVLLFAFLRTLWVTSASVTLFNMGNGPPSPENLETQIQVLQAASYVRPSLQGVTYVGHLSWISDRVGCWTALYRGLFGRTMVLTSTTKPLETNHSEDSES